MAFATNFCPITSDLSGNTVWPQTSSFQKSSKWTIFCIFNELFFTQNVYLARFARNVEWDFLCDFQTLCLRWRPPVGGEHLHPSTSPSKMGHFPMYFDGLVDNNWKLGVYQTIGLGTEKNQKYFDFRIIDENFLNLNFQFTTFASDFHVLPKVDQKWTWSCQQNVAMLRSQCYGRHFRI